MYFEKIKRFLHAVKTVLVEPPESVQGNWQRRRLRFVSSFLLVYSIYALIGSLVTAIIREDNIGLILVVTGIALALAYGLSRTKYHSLASVLALIIPAFPSFSYLYLSRTPPDSFESIMWLAVPLIVSSLIVSTRCTIFISILYSVGLLLLVPVAGISSTALSSVLPFIFITSFVVVSITTIRKKDHVEIERQIVELEITEAELRQQKLLTDRILEATPNAVVVLDISNTILMANRTFTKSFRVEENYIEGMFLEELIPMPELLDAISTVVDKKVSLKIVEFRYKGNSTEKIYKASILAMKENMILVLLNDITEERRKQESLQILDRLSSLGEMAAGVAHELNNPLTGIIGMSQLLIIEENLPVPVREDIEDILSEAERAAEIVRNLLTFSRHHSEKREKTQLNTVIHNVLKLRAYEHHVNNIEIKTDLDSELPEVVVDSFQMQQVFLNIVLNAEYAMSETNKRGTLSIDTKKLDGRIEISFTDDGPGIASENVARVFNPFFTTKEVGKGTGLGLSISYGIIRNHGGNIRIRDDHDKGATIIVELPENN